MAQKRRTAKSPAEPEPAQPIRTAKSAAELDGYYQGIMCDMDRILKHPRFAVVKNFPVLSIEEGGACAPVTDDALKASMSKGGELTALGNFWDQNILDAATPGIPIRRERVQKLADHKFPEPPKSCPWIIDIAVPTLEWKATEHRGDWPRASPEEPVHAVILAVIRDLDNKVEDSVLDVWVTMFRNVRYNFIYMPDKEDRYWHSARLREEQKSLSAAIKWTGAQRTLVKKPDNDKRKLS